jgi:Flp pilus assembly protein TadD
MADSLVRKGRCEEAQSFLEAAVDDSPLDSDTAFALGAFYFNQERSSEVDKAAQLQLLKAAKLDPSEANPFALLGLWFEEKGISSELEGVILRAWD